MTDHIHTVVLCDVDGVLTDGAVYVDADGRETLRFCKRDGWLIEQSRAMGIEVVMITDDPAWQAAAARAEKLGVTLHGPCVTGMTKKLAVKYYQATGKRVVFIGDSPADVEAMRAADEAWCPDDGRATFEEVMRAPVRGGDGVLYHVLDRMIWYANGGE